MTVLDPSFEPSLHVFEQDGGWQWALTVKRATGVGVKVVAFSREAFAAKPRHTPPASLPAPNMTTP